ncbi:MaoC/PaaZ C-terminal domain-containing protein [Tropicimonas isoalkanivorans]|uniref:MaoC like domain-containing protein n=1 Tax=Tropicimonas isoalkanivorans TaxID=441112 RepID=A0A1I1HYW0_9RHOB|nr:MaoC/PaaZ C-terminal domain-containing protein [Tropicimonas isoalkanivorans]SFC28762.1 MaoC like domain-containing protein [Tropicimonas isoalkanivorans]
MTHDVVPRVEEHRGPITRMHLVEWCAAENDYYILHYDERHALRMGFQAPLIQGTYKFALLGQLIARCWPEARLDSVSIRYVRADSEGIVLTLSAEETACEEGAGGTRRILALTVTGEDASPSATGEATIVTPQT